MTQKRSFVTLSAKQTLAWYQHHIQVMHGYALALGLKAGLSPAEMARMFVELWLAIPASFPCGPLLLSSRALHARLRTEERLLG